MTQEGTARRIASAVVVFSLVLYGLLELLAFMTPAASVVPTLRSQAGTAQHLFNWAFLPFSLVGALLISRRPQNPIGWLLCAVGLLTLTQGFAQNYAFYALYANPGGLPAGGFLAWLATWMWLAGSVVVLAPLPLLFPDGKLPSSRWRGVIWLVAGAVGLGIAIGSLSRNALADYGLRNPFGIFPSGAHRISMVVLLGVLSLSPVLSTIAVVRRFRRADAEQRQQIKWFATAVALQAALLVAETLVFATTGLQPYRIPAINFLTAAVLALLPVSIGIAVLKYRLYDIDIVINKTVLFGSMAAFITLVYVAIVVGIGHLVGTGGKPNLVLSIVATALVAVAFQPVRERVQRAANRLVYGKRATPYEVLSQFSHRVAGVYSSEEVLPRMASVLAEGTGAARADVWIRLGDTIAPAASWPSRDGPAPAPVDITGQTLPLVPSLSRIVPVHHQGELLGALSINKRPGEALTPVEEKLLADLAAQAGLVLRNVRLTAELQARLTEISRQAVELRASRKRIVAAQDAERRRLERNIHDGAQQNLVALTVKLRLATNLARRDPERARDSVKTLEDESDQALATLRALARGIYPPLLREQGLVAAVRAEAEKIAVPADVTADHIDRYGPDIEAAVYFVCLEALQNVTKHAMASHVQITLHLRKTALSFVIADDGTGFDVRKDGKGSGLRNMSDRIDAIGGRLEIRSAPQGTTVIGMVPIRAMEPVG